MEEADRDPKAAKPTPNSTAPYAVLSCVIPYIDDQKDRNAVSLVCRWCRDLDALTRKHLTVGLGYGLALTPDRVRWRFGRLESMKLKAKAWRASFTVPVDWSIHITPWVKEIAANFSHLESLHFLRTPIRDSDLQILARARGETLRVLKIDKCMGFSTDGLLHIGRLCRQLRTLFLEGSKIQENDGQWLHELAMNNSVLESLNFHTTYLVKVSVKDLELLAKNCGSLVSVKVSHIEIYDLADFFRAATVLEEICGVFIWEQRAEHPDLPLPRRLCQLGFLWLGKMEMPILFPFAATLRKLDLLNALAGTEEDQCLLIQKCPNLETLEAGNGIGDRGLEFIAQSCKRLKRLRIGESTREIGPRDKEGAISEKGLIALARGCLELEHLALYIPDITNAALECIGTHLYNLCDFRLLLLDQEERTTDSPLDSGVRALLNGCKKLRRIALYLRAGSLTDLELCFITHFRPNIKWKHLK